MSRAEWGTQAGLLERPQWPYAPSPRVQEGLRREGQKLWLTGPELERQRFLELLARRHHCALDQILLGPSRESLIYLTALCFCEGGDGRPVLGELPGRRSSRKSRPFRRGAEELWQLSFDDYIAGTQVASCAAESDFRYSRLLAAAGLRLQPALRNACGHLLWPRGLGLYLHSCPDLDGGALTGLQPETWTGEGEWLLDLSWLAFSALESEFWSVWAPAEGGMNRSSGRLSLQQPPFLQLYAPGLSLGLPGLHLAYLIGPEEKIKRLRAGAGRLPWPPVGRAELALLNWALQDDYYYQRAYQTCREMRRAWLQHARELGYMVREGVLAELYFSHPLLEAELLLERLQDRGVGLCSYYAPSAELRLQMGSRGQLQALLYILEDLLEGLPRG